MQSGFGLNFVLSCLGLGLNPSKSWSCLVHDTLCPRSGLGLGLGGLDNNAANLKCESKLRDVKPEYLLLAPGVNQFSPFKHNVFQLNTDKHKMPSQGLIVCQHYVTRRLLGYKATLNTVILYHACSTANMG